jgi:hypothetical protein
MSQPNEPAALGGLPDNARATRHLPDAWAEAWVDAVVSSGVRCVTTIENEYPFISYVEQAGGPSGLAGRDEIVVYTASSTRCFSTA